MQLPPKTSIGGALSLQIQHKTRLQLFADYSSDDVLSAVLLSDSEDECESLSDDDIGNNTSTDMDIDDHEAESQFEHVRDIASTLPMAYHSEKFSRLDLLDSTLEKLKILDAPTPDCLTQNGWEKHLRKLLTGESEPPYRVCRLHGASSRYFLKATRFIRSSEALGVLVGRLIETSRWEQQHALKAKKAKNAKTTTHRNGVGIPDDGNKQLNEVESSTFRWEITANSLKQISRGAYSGPDLMIDLHESANELVHLHDPFWEEEGACAEESNTQLYTSLIKDPVSGISLPTTVLYSTRDIKNGETLTVNWDDAYWSEVSERENLTAAATAWGSLHFPLLQLRDLAFRQGIPVPIIAPYYPDEIQKYKQHKKEIEMSERLEGVVEVEKSNPTPPSVPPTEPNKGDEEEHEQQEVELEMTEVLEVNSEDDVESVGGGAGGGSGGCDDLEFETSDQGSEAFPSIRIELTTSSNMGTFTDGKHSDQKMNVQGKKKRRKKKKNATKMFMDSEGSWWLDDGNSPRLLIEGARSTHRTMSLTNNNTTNSTRTSMPVPSAGEVSLYRHQYENKPTVGKQNLKTRFRTISGAELSQMSYTCHCDFSRIPEADLKTIATHAKNTQYALPQSVLKSIDTGICPKIEVTEIMSLHHPVRFLTRPDRHAFGVNVKPGCRFKPDEPIGIYVGEGWREQEYIEAKGHDVDKQMYTYSMTAVNIAECLGYDSDWAEKKANSTFPTLMFDAYESGNVMRFINDVYAREGNPKPNVGAEACVDQRTGLPYMLMRWIGGQNSRENEELMVDYGATQYWKVGGRALHRDLKRHAEVAFTAIVRLKAALAERGIRRELIEAAAEPVDISRLEYYQKKMG